MQGPKTGGGSIEGGMFQDDKVGLSYFPKYMAGASGGSNPRARKREASMACAARRGAARLGAATSLLWVAAFVVLSFWPALCTLGHQRRVGVPGKAHQLRVDGRDLLVEPARDAAEQAARRGPSVVSIECIVVVSIRRVI